MPSLSSKASFSRSLPPPLPLTSPCSGSVSVTGYDTCLLPANKSHNFCYTVCAMLYRNNELLLHSVCNVV